LSAAVQSEPHRRAAQIALAEDVTRRVHGEAGLGHAREATAALFGGAIDGLDPDVIEDIFADVPSSSVAREGLAGEGMSIVDLLIGSGVASSKGDARRSIEGGGVYLNNHRVSDAERRLFVEDTIDGRFLLLRKGKKSYHLVAING